MKELKNLTFDQCITLLYALDDYKDRSKSKTELRDIEHLIKQIELIRDKLNFERK